MANSYLSRTNGSAATLGTKYTVSVWLKRSGLANSAYHYIISHDAGGNPRTHIRFQDTTDDLSWYIRDASGTGTSLTTSRLFRDTSAWYHIVCAYDSTQSTASNRQKIYVNGVQETSFSSSGYVAQNTVSPLSENSNAFKIGSFGGSASNYFDGYMSHFVFVDGLALTPTSFGETDATSGIWKFKGPSGITFGNNGYHLKFENSGALGTDSSGNSNNFTVNGNLKQALDTPSNVHTTLNAIATDQTLTNGNTTAQHSGSGDNYQSALTTFAVTSGKWYCECKVTKDNNYPGIGIATTDSPEATLLQSDYLGESTKSYGYYTDGEFYNNGSTVATGQATFATDDIMGMALDLDSAQNTLKLYKNGTLIYTQNLADTPQGWFFGCTNQSTRTSARGFFNFGNGFFGTTAITSAGSNGNGSLFEYDVPSGHYALNTKNINTYG